MIETKDLILDKAKLSDCKKMYENVWCHEESARYMYWSVTTNEEDAYARMERTINFQKDHDTYLIYEKQSGEPIGFAGMELVREGVCEETGICLGPKFIHKGYGKQVLNALIIRAREVYHADTLLYSARENNIASRSLAASMGFEQYGEEMKEDPRDSSVYKMLHFKKKIG